MHTLLTVACLRFDIGCADQVSPLTQRLTQHLREHEDNQAGMFDAVLRRCQSVPDLLEAIVNSDGGDDLFSYLLNADIAALQSDTPRFEALKSAPGVQVCNVHLSKL